MRALMIKSCLCFGLSLSPILGLAQDLPTYDIPRLDTIQIDGSSADWEGQGFQVNILADEKGRMVPSEDLSASFRLGWNDQGVLVLVKVHDNTD
ncbi:MAG: hypothetical protein V2A34_03330, partial [Lentisphaerota bacterium]